MFILRKLSIASIIVFVLGLPFVLAAEHSVKTDMVSFVNAFKYLFRGNTNGFAESIVGALPLFAVVLIVFGLSFFLGKLTIFKDDLHTKYARMVAIGIALIGLATQSLYDSILNWTGAFLNITFILAIVFMFIMFLSFLRKNNYEMSKEMMSAQKDSLSVKKELRHVQQDFKLDEKEREKVMHDLGDLSSKLDSMKKLSGSELQMIDKLADLLRKATAAAGNNDKAGAHGYTQMLTKEIGTLITTMKHEGVDENSLDGILMNIDRELDKWGHHSDLEKNEEKHLNMIFSKISSKVQSAGDDVAKRMVKDLMKKDEANLLHLLREIRAKLIHLSQLKDAIMKGAEELRSSGYRAKHMEAQAVRTAIFNMQFTEAHNHLDQLRSLVEHEPTVLSKVKEFDSQMMQVISQIEALHDQLRLLLNHEIAGIVKLVKEEKDDARTKMSVAADISNSANDIFATMVTIIHSLKSLSRVQGIDRGKQFDVPKQFIIEKMGVVEGLANNVKQWIHKKIKDHDLKTEIVRFTDELERIGDVMLTVQTENAHASAEGAKLLGNSPLDAQIINLKSQIVNTIERLKNHIPNL